MRVSESMSVCVRVCKYVCESKRKKRKRVREREKERGKERERPLCQTRLHFLWLLSGESQGSTRNNTRPVIPRSLPPPLSDRPHPSITLQQEAVNGHTLHRPFMSLKSASVSACVCACV